MRLKLLTAATLGVAALALTALPDAEAKRKKKADPLSAACKGDLSEFVATPGSGSSNTFLRSAFDTDPSGYLGRFVPDGATSIDESAAATTRCSEFISWRKIDGGGVILDNFYQASSQAAMNVGVIGVGGGTSGAQDAMVRVSYTLTDKMVAEIDDPAGFEDCCKAAPDQCTDTYIGEFIGGTGAIWCGLGQAADFDLDIIASGVVADMEIAHGAVWRRSTQFPNPVYFAFKTTETAFTDIEPGCGEWTTQAPQSTQGLYFVGLSNEVASEQEARTWALTHARLQVLDWAAQQTGGTDMSFSMSTETGMSAETEISGAVQTAVEGVAGYVKDQNWCVEEVGTPGGTLYKTYVLAFLSNADAEAAKGVVTGAPGGQPPEDGPAPEGDQPADDPAPEGEQPADDAPPK